MKFKDIDSLLNRQTQANADAVIVKIGMSTCGIAAGANAVYEAFNEVLNKKAHLGLNYKIEKVGCLGLCFCEPNVEIDMPGMPDVLYGKVDKDFVWKIVEDHIVDRRIVNERLYDKPVVNLFKHNEIKMPGNE